MNKLNLFPNEEIFKKAYDEFLESSPQASQRVKDSYSGMHTLFETYLDACEEDIFRHAYQCGYEACMKANAALLQKGGAAV